MKLSAYVKEYQEILGKTGFTRTQAVLVYLGRCDGRSKFFRHFHDYRGDKLRRFPLQRRVRRRLHHDRVHCCPDGPV
ncbi:hypothetical protein [Fibrobacter sp. UWH4]|uniref:hypothetical protein n=1 Tax=Fibrobacter sp. UWH4 TaxID=1896210 RepID=UPI001587BCA8